MTHDYWAMQESRAQRDILVSKRMPTRSKFVELSISDAVGAHKRNCGLSFVTLVTLVKK